MYFVYLSPHFSQYYIGSRMYIGIFTTVIRDSFKNYRFKKAGLVKYIPKRH